MTQIRYIGRCVVTGRIKLLSGLHIGAGKDTVEIGGLDNPVIKHPHTGRPYIPGSSLKGKLRFLMEWAFGKIRSDGHPWGFDTKDKYQSFENDDPILRIFGSPAKKETWDYGPTRLIVRDAPLDEVWVREVLSRGMPLTEEKTEVVIDRIAGKAHDAGPRTMERVPAGASFTMELIFRLFDTGDRGTRDKQCFNWLLAALSLLEHDALGGSGSRGYGRVTFEDLKVRKPDGEEAMLGAKYRVNRFDTTEAPKVVEL
jgi:CRISPR-associated protein Csm3